MGTQLGRRWESCVFPSVLESPGVKAVAKKYMPPWHSWEMHTGLLRRQWGIGHFVGFCLSFVTLQRALSQCVTCSESRQEWH